MILLATVLFQHSPTNFLVRKFIPKQPLWPPWSSCIARFQQGGDTATLDHNKTHYDNSILQLEYGFTSTSQSPQWAPPLLHIWQHLEESPLQICADKIHGQAFHQKYQLCWVWNLPGSVRDLQPVHCINIPMPCDWTQICTHRRKGISKSQLMDHHLNIHLQIKILKCIKLHWTWQS